MKLKNWVFIAGACIVFSSCGENSTSPEATKDTSGVNNTSVSATPATEPVEVPPATKTHFETAYPNATNVTWTRYDEPVSTIEWDWTAWPVLDTNDYVVNYDWNGMDYYTWYDENGNWIGSTGTVTDIANLPTAVSNAVKKQFSGYTVTSVDKENDKNREAYEIKMERGDDKMKALITSDGTVLKKKGKEDGEKVKEKTDVK
jgi:hypothetical protein